MTHSLCDENAGKKCKDPIAQGSLRIARMVQSPFFDGLQPLW